MPSKRGRKKSQKEKKGPRLVDLASGKACEGPSPSPEPKNAEEEGQLDISFAAEEAEQEGSETNVEEQEFENGSEEGEGEEEGTETWVKGVEVEAEWNEEDIDDEEEDEEEEEPECDCDPDKDLEVPKCFFDEGEAITCFFHDLPPLELPQYLQCQNCGKRFEPEDFEPHSLRCVRMMVEVQAPTIIQEQKIPKYGPPFFLKKIVQAETCTPRPVNPCCYEVFKEKDLCRFYEC